MPEKGRDKNVPAFFFFSMPATNYLQEKPAFSPIGRMLTKNISENLWKNNNLQEACQHEKTECFSSFCLTSGCCGCTGPGLPGLPRAAGKHGRANRRLARTHYSTVGRGQPFA